MTRRLCSSIGACIYCGATNDLSDEHLFPEGAGGDVVVPDASCPDCAAETSKFELSCLRKFFGLTRAYLGIYGERRRDQRPVTFPVTGVFDDSVEQVAVRDYPFSVVQLELDSAGILVGCERYPAGELTTDFRMKIVTIEPAIPRFTEFQDRFPAKAITLDVPISDFYRLLAKVAHAFAVAVIGHRAFKPALAEFIRTPGGEINEASYFIGGAYEFGRPVETIGNAPHAHQATLLRGWAREKKWLVVRVQLFAPVGAIYDVFTGWLE